MVYGKKFNTNVRIYFLFNLKKLFQDESTYNCEYLFAIISLFELMSYGQKYFFFNFFYGY